MIFRTLNSTYEVDYDNSRIRRLTGIDVTLTSPVQRES